MRIFIHKKVKKKKKKTNNKKQKTKNPQNKGPRSDYLPQMRSLFMSEYIKRKQANKQKKKTPANSMIHFANQILSPLMLVKISQNLVMSWFGGGGGLNVSFAIYFYVF